MILNLILMDVLRYMPEHGGKVNDMAYTKQEIRTLLETANTTV
jgi:hypothetical protein